MDQCENFKINRLKLISLLDACNWMTHKSCWLPLETCKINLFLRLTLIEQALKISEIKSHWNKIAVVELENYFRGNALASEWKIPCNVMFRGVAYDVWHPEQFDIANKWQKWLNNKCLTSYNSFASRQVAPLVSQKRKFKLVIWKQSNGLLLPLIKLALSLQYTFIYITDKNPLSLTSNIT